MGFSGLLVSIPFFRFSELDGVYLSHGYWFLGEALG